MNSKVITVPQTYSSTRSKTNKLKLYYNKIHERLTNPYNRDIYMALFKYYVAPDRVNMFAGTMEMETIKLIATGLNLSLHTWNSEDVPELLNNQAGYMIIVSNNTDKKILAEFARKQMRTNNHSVVFSFSDRYTDYRRYLNLPRIAPKPSSMNFMNDVSAMLNVPISYQHYYFLLND